MLGAGPVGQLAGEDRIIAGGRFELVEKRHLNAIVAGGIEGSVSAVLDGGTQIAHELLRLRIPILFGQTSNGGWREAVYLVRIEHGECFGHEAKSAPIVAALFIPATMIALLPEEDLHTSLTLTDLSTAF